MRLTRLLSRSAAIAAPAAFAFLGAGCDRGEDTATAQAPVEPAAEEAPAPAAEPAAPAGTPIAADFTPNPMTMTGTAGGPRDGSNFTGTAPHTDCRGWMPQEPQHTLVLSDAIDNLQIVAAAPTDLTMAIEGPAGTWCNDDFQGLDPGLMANWPAGTYRVFVGTYAEASTQDYTLSLQRIEVAPTTTQALAPGFLPDPYTVAGNSGGPRSADTFTGVDERCAGHFPSEPQHILELQAFDELQVVANAAGEGDLTIAIEGPAGTFCNDDFEGLDPGVRRAFPAGTYRVFVGSLFGGSYAYNLNVTELF